MAIKHIPDPGAPVHLGDFLLQDTRFPAVYFLYHHKRVVYVGQSKTLKWRIDTHIAEGVKVFDEIAYIRCTIDRLLAIEAHYIRKWAPKYNGCGVARVSRERKTWKRQRKPRWGSAKKTAAKASG